MTNTLDGTRYNARTPEQRETATVKTEQPAPDAAQRAVTVPPAGQSAYAATQTAPAAGGELPTLPAPTAKPSSAPLLASGLSLEVLLDAICAQERDTEVKAGMASVTARAEERQIATQQRLEQMQAESEHEKKSEHLTHASRWLELAGVGIGAVAGVATCVVGVAVMVGTGWTGAGIAAGGAVLVAGLGTLLLTADSAIHLVLSFDKAQVFGGKYKDYIGCSPGHVVGLVVRGIMKACGCDQDKIDMWAGISKGVVDLGCALVFAVVGIAGGILCPPVAAAGVAEAVVQAANAVGVISQLASGGVEVLNAGVNAANTGETYKAATAQVEQQKLNAVLERIAMDNELDVAHVREMLERGAQLLQTVSDIVSEGSAAQKAIMGGRPAMA